MPYCQFIYIPERDMFETVVSFKYRQLAKKSIEVEYTECYQNSFIVGQVYIITARFSPLKRCYTNIITFPKPDTIITL